MRTSGAGPGAVGSAISIAREKTAVFRAEWLLSNIDIPLKEKFQCYAF